MSAYCRRVKSQAAARLERAPEKKEPIRASAGACNDTPRSAARMQNLGKETRGHTYHISSRFAAPCLALCYTTSCSLWASGAGQRPHNTNTTLRSLRTTDGKYHKLRLDFCSFRSQILMEFCNVEIAKQQYLQEFDKLSTLPVQNG